MKDEVGKIFCCFGFRNGIEAAGQRGMAILVHNSSAGLMFLLQSRGIAFKDIDKLHPNPNAADLKINICSETGLQYCPWCGRRLKELIEASPEAYEELAKQHKQLHTGP